VCKQNGGQIERRRRGKDRKEKKEKKRVKKKEIQNSVATSSSPFPSGRFGQGGLTP